MDVLNITHVPTPLHIKLNKIIAIAMVTRIVTQRNLTYMEQIFKVVYLLSFSLFLKLSNMVALSISDFFAL